MAGDTFGKLFSVTTYGESHGPSMGGVVDGCPPGLEISEDDIQVDLDRRRPGRSRYVTQRKEPDQIKILSGVFEGVTTGTAIGLAVENVDQRSRDYSKIKDTFRPVMLIIPISKSTVFVIIEVAGALLLGRQLCGLQPVLLPVNILKID